jgi:hypothetical protein
MIAGSNPLLSNWKYVLKLAGKLFYNGAIPELCIMCWNSLRLGVSAVGTPSVSSTFFFQKSAVMSIRYTKISMCTAPRLCFSSEDGATGNVMNWGLLNVYLAQTTINSVFRFRFAAYGSFQNFKWGRYSQTNIYSYVTNFRCAWYDK